MDGFDHAHELDECEVCSFVNQQSDAYCELIGGLADLSDTPSLAMNIVVGIAAKMTIAYGVKSGSVSLLTKEFVEKYGKAVLHLLSELEKVRNNQKDSVN